VTDTAVLKAATACCERNRAFLIVDPPPAAVAGGTGLPGVGSIEDCVATTIPPSPNSALYFPYLTTTDPLTGLAFDRVNDQPYEMSPSGTIAGVFARNDANHGVWKAAQGPDTKFKNVIDVVERGRVDENRQQELNDRGVNCIRNVPGIGPAVWGARTTISADPSPSDWKYIPVRRMALFLEQSIYAGLGWVVFEPNSEPLWRTVRSDVEAFMSSLFRQGAFQGQEPREAFIVKCGRETMTQQDIDNGTLNVVVGFAPLRPAEFVVIRIAQLLGQC
jgi:phage tail sheath protein FI